MIQFLMAAAPAALDAIQAGFGASSANQQAEAEYEASMAQAKAQIELNKEAAKQEYIGAQQNLNSKIQAAAMKREDMLVKLTEARGSFAAQEGKSGKSFKRYANLSTFGQWGRDSARLSEMITQEVTNTEDKARRTAAEQYQRDANALSRVKIPTKQNVGLAILGSALKSTVGILGAQAQYDIFNKSKGFDYDKYKGVFDTDSMAGITDSSAFFNNTDSLRIRVGGK